MMPTSAQITQDTADTIARFNDAFQRRDRAALAAVVHEDCVMVSAQPAPEGTTHMGKDGCMAFWAELMDDASTRFEVDHVFFDGPWAAVRWRYRFGPTDAESVLGVNLTRVVDSQVIEQLGYSKAPGEVLPLPKQPSDVDPASPEVIHPQPVAVAGRL